jgi:hypothetical protein
MHPQDMSGGETRAPSSPQVVPLILPDNQNEALREDCLSALHGVLDDLASPDLLRDPGVTAGEGEVYRRLLEALDSEEIRVPDEEMAALIRRESDLYYKAVDAKEVVARHEANHALLRVLGGSTEEEDEEEEEDEAERSPGPGWLGGDEVDCRREVLALLLGEAPDCLSFSEVVVALAGDYTNVGEANDLRDAIQTLVAAGLARRQDGVLAPTRPARRMAELGFRIG